ncbi:MAG TPA: hypothetical protein VF188_00495 [Longimicrobiales bacterium]
MVGPYHPYREPEDIGSDSPATGEAKSQRISGIRGGPRQARTRGKGRQPPQESGRRSARHEQIPTEPKSFAPEEDPSRQGTGAPSPERLAARSRQQGITPRSGMHRAHGETTEAEAQQGPPAHGHTRHGRQRVPGRPERPARGNGKPD